MNTESWAFKFPADTPRVSRSSAVTSDLIVSNGDMYEDGKQRLHVPMGWTDEKVAEFTEILEEYERLQAEIAERAGRITRLLAGFGGSDHDQG